jgi:phospholipase/carboxylesterase
MIIHNQPVQQAGKPLSAASKVLVMVHGRGDSAKSFIELSSELNAPADEFAFLAIQAIQNTWYPYSFLAPVNQNESNLSLSLSACLNYSTT